MKDWKMPLPEDSAIDKNDIILYAFRGSHSHGTYVPSTDPDSIDDIDTMGVFFYPISFYCGVPTRPYPQTVGLWEGEWDVVYYEIRHFARLLVKNNPNVLSMLFLRDEDYLLLAEPGREIIKNKHLFCSRLAAKTFVGYAQSQMKKMTAFSTGLGHMGEKRKKLVEKFGYDTKNASHCIRLLRMGFEFVKTGEMNVRRPDFEELLDIKRGKWPLDRVKKEAESVFDSLEEIVSKSPLPELPDVDGANQLVVSLMRKHFPPSVDIE